MARRVTGGPGNWGYQQPPPPPPQSQPAYLQQYQPVSTHQYSVFQTPNQTTTANTTSDPWNWGWDESANNEPGNNNVKSDPTWDWSVDGSNSYQQPRQPQQPQQPVANPGVNYGSEPVHPQAWHSPAPLYASDGRTAYNQPNSYSNIPQTAPNTQTLIEDSFNSSSVVHQNTFSQQPVIFQTVSKSGQNFCAFGTKDQGLHLTNNNVEEHKLPVHQVPQSNGNSNSNASQVQHYNSEFYQGFPVGSNDVGLQQSQATEYTLQGRGLPQKEENKTETQNMEMQKRSPDARADSKCSEQSNAFDIKPEVSTDLPSMNDIRVKSNELSEDVPVIDYRRFGAATGNETLPSQWSTESLASQGSEELSQAADGTTGGSVQGEVTEGVVLHDNPYNQSYPYNYKLDLTANNAGQQHDVSRVPWEQESALSYTPEFPNHLEPDTRLLKQEILSASSSPETRNFRDQAAMGNVTSLGSVKSEMHSELYNETKLVQSDYLVPPVSASSQHTVDNVTNILKTLSLGDTGTSNSTDVENVEIVPPENNPPAGLYPLSGLGSADSTPPPPPTIATPPLAPPKGAASSSNPYASRNASLNHKYASKHRLLTHPSSSDVGVERMNYAMNLTQTESDPATGVSHFGSPSEMVPPLYTGTTGNFNQRNKVPVMPTAEDAVNLETVPDNKERPDFVDLQQSMQVERKSASPMSGTRPHTAPLGQDSVRGPVASWGQQQSMYNMSPENQEVAPRCGPERNQYLETGQLPEDDVEVHGQIPDVGDSLQYHHQQRVSEPFLPPPGLHRMVPGQLMEQENATNGPQNESNHQAESRSNEDVSTPPPGLHRMVPGQFTENETPGVLDNTASNLSHQNVGADDGLLLRMVPGRLTEDVITGSPPQDDTNDNVVLPGNVIDEIPPPGLRRMVPGESSSPESQGNSGPVLAQGGGVPTGTFQPIDSMPMEPRVVTGVAQDEMDVSGSQGTSLQLSPSPIQLSSSGRASSETESLSPEQSITTNTLTQPPTERSETIGSDSVETYPPPPSDNAPRELSARRDNMSKERERRHREEQDGEERNRRRQTNGREYYTSREREESPSGGGRYREDRERRPYDRDRERDRDREDSPNGGRYRYDPRQEYGRRGHEEEHRPRHRRGYDRSDDDADTEGYFSDRERDRDRNLDRDRDRERDRRENPGGYRDDYSHHYRGRTERERVPHESQAHEKGSRDRPDLRVGGRVRERDNDRERDRYHDRRRYDYHDRDYRRMEDYYTRGYEDDPYYRNSQRSRPSSRTGSRPEYEDERRRDYHSYPAMNYYNPRSMHDVYYQYQYQQYMAQWQQQHHHQQQQLAQQGAYPEDRGSVHSGRSSANEELHRERVPAQNSSAVEGVASPPQRLTPAKFTTAHVKAVLSAHGQLLKTPAHYPMDGQPAIVEMHGMQKILGADPTYQELRDFPGPLVRNVTHKKSAIGFCLRKIQKAERDPNLFDRESVILFWRLLILLLKQNGTVVGSDIAELLLLNSSGQESASHTPQPAPSPAISQSSVNEPQHEEQPAPNKTEEEITTLYRDCLLYGNTKEALEWAMKHGLWGHALFLASKMDQRTYANVMMRFANGLTLNDPLQTLYQLMSGRLPAAVTCCADEKWGDWKPHLAMILSNSSQWDDLHRQAITTLGDTLAARGCLHAAHFCYVMAQLDFGMYGQKASKIVLLGSSHTKPFCEFANNEAIQMTELYLYAIQLANPELGSSHFQPYKLLYAQRLAEHGMPMEALQYVEVIAKAVVMHPTLYELNFLQRVYDLGNQLKYHDPMYTEGEGEDVSWLINLAVTIEAYMSGLLQGEGPSYGSTSNLSYYEGDSLQPQYQGMDSMQQAQDSQHYDSSWQQQQHQETQQWQQQPGMDNRTEGYQPEIEPAPDPNRVMGVDQTNYLSHPEQGTDANSAAGMQQQQQQHQNQLNTEEYHTSSASGDGVGSEGQPSNAAFDYWSVSASQQQEGGPQISLSGSVPLDEPGGPQSLSQRTPEDKAPTKPKPRKERPKSAASSSWFGGIWNKLALRPKNQMILPDDKNPSIVWDPDRKRWTNVDSDEDESVATFAPPPKVSKLPAINAAPIPGVVAEAPGSNEDVRPPPSGPNIYKMARGRGSRANYVDVLGGQSAASNPVVPAPALFQPPTATAPLNIFVPEPVEAKENDPIDFLSSVPPPSEVPEQMSGESSQNGAAEIPVQAAYGGPLMFNPSSFSQPAGVPSTGNLNRKRYPN